MKIPNDPKAKKLRELEKERGKSSETQKQMLERIELKLERIELKLDLLLKG